MPVEAKLLKHLDLARACVNDVSKSSVDLTLITLRWNLESIKVLVSTDPAFDKSFVVARRTCVKLIEAVRRGDADEGDFRRASSSLDKLEAKLTNAKPSSAARRLGVGW